MSRPPSWLPAALRARADALFAGAFCLAWLVGLAVSGRGLGRGTLTLLTLFAVLMTVPFAWRRHYPLQVAALVFGTGALQAIVHRGELPIGFVLTALVAAYTVGSYGRGRTMWLTLVLAFACLEIGSWLTSSEGTSSKLLTAPLFLLPAWGVGVLIGRLREQRASLQALNVRLEQEQHKLAAASVAEEKARIARELHDIVAHSLSVIVLQAGAAEQLAGHGEDAREQLEVIRTTGQEAMGEMRRLLGVLRTDEPTATAPRPGLHTLDALVETARRSGLRTQVTVTGVPQQLAPGVDVAAYRLVQESLSNVRKHARATSVDVAVAYGADHLTIDVVDDGVGAVAAPPAVGHGIIGMRERVALYGGRLVCGPRTVGGWQMHAELPTSS